MSSPKAKTKAATKSAGRKRSVSEPSSADKVAFGKALLKGVQPEADKKNDAPEVELLRKIPAPEPIVENEASARAVALAAEIEKALRDGDLDKFQPHAQQALIAALCRLYGANNEMGNRFSAIGQPSVVSATDVMVLCGALLKAVDLQVFELGLWQSWSAR